MSGFGRRVLVKLRGILGLGVVAGVAGLGIGAIWAIATARLEFGFFPDLTNWLFLRDAFLPSVIEWGARGALAGAGFGVALTALESRSSLEQLTTRRIALYGALVGVVLAEGILRFRTLTGPLVFLDAAIATLLAAGFFGVLGATLSTSLVTIARRAQRRELAGDEGAEALLAAK